MKNKEWSELDFASIQFSMNNRTILDAYGTRLVELYGAGDYEGFLKKRDEFEAFCRSAGDAGAYYWEDTEADDQRVDIARARAAGLPDPPVPSIDPEVQARHDAELAELRRKHEAGELGEGLALDVGKIMSDMEEKAVEYGRDHVDGFVEAQTRAAFRKGARSPPKKSIFQRLFGK